MTGSKNPSVPTDVEVRGSEEGLPRTTGTDTRPEVILTVGGGPEPYRIGENIYEGACPGNVETDEPSWTPPDGGYGWVIVFVSFFIYVLFASISQTGLFLIEWQDYFQVSITDMGWLNAFHTIFGRLLGIFIGPLIGHFGCRWVALIGAVLLAGGQVATAFAPNMLVMYISYGVIQSAGTCCYFSVGIVSVQQYFNKKRTIAAGLGYSGVNVGFFLWPPFAAWLLQKFGWQRTYLIQAAIQLAGGVLCCVLLKPPKVRSDRKKSAKRNVAATTVKMEDNKSQLHLKKSPYAKETATANHSDNISKSSMCSKISNAIPIDTAPLRYVSWWMFMGYVTLNTCNYGVTAFYTPLRSEMLGLSTGDAALQLSLLGILAMVFTPAFSFLGNLPTVDRRLVVGAGVFVASISTVVSAWFTTLPLLLVHIVIHSIGEATVFACDNAVIVDIVGVKNVAAGGGWYMVAMGMGHAIFQPSTGLMIDITGSAKLPFTLFGAFGVLGALLVSLVPVVQRRVDKRNFAPGTSPSTADLLATNTEGENGVQLMATTPLALFY